MSTHQSVLLTESIQGLAIRPDGIYVDGTFGRGGHARAILNALNQDGQLIAIDKDLEAVACAKAEFANDSRLTMVHGSFAGLAEIAHSQGVYGRINGILLDLGVSSPQLDNPERGFSFMKEGPLDMRMNNAQAEDAATFVNRAPEEEMVWVFRQYGEERFAGRIAKAIVTARQEAPITSTITLAEIIKQANPKWEKHKHPATRVFQAIRIHVNQELVDLTQFLNGALDVLCESGRLVIISFHSLEDRIVKQFMRAEAKGPHIPFSVPIKARDIQTRFRCIGKAIKPSDEEVKKNGRARSAVLRIGEKIA